MFLTTGALPWHVEPGDGSFILLQGASKLSSFLQTGGAGSFSLHWKVQREYSKPKFMQRPDSPAQWKVPSFSELLAVKEWREWREWAVRHDLSSQSNREKSPGASERGSRFW